MESVGWTLVWEPWLGTESWLTRREFVNDLQLKVLVQGMGWVGVCAHVVWGCCYVRQQSEG